MGGYRQGKGMMDNKSGQRTPIRIVAGPLPGRFTRIPVFPGRHYQMSIMPPPVAAPRTTDGKIATNPGAILVMFALASLHVEPDAGVIQFSGRRWLVILDKGKQFIPQFGRQGPPVPGVKGAFDRVHKRRVTHMHTADAASLTIID